MTKQDNVTKPYKFMNQQEREQYIKSALQNGTLFVDPPKIIPAVLKSE